MAHGLIKCLVFTHWPRNWELTTTRPIVRRIIQWANHVAHRRSDTRQSLTPAKFIHGGTIGPAANYAKKQ
jgi:hypothetical protein